MTDWSKELASARELQPSHRRHVRATDKYVMRIPLEPEERDYFDGTHDTAFTHLLDENLVLATKLVQEYTTVPVPKVIHYVPEMTVLEWIDGVDLDEAWNRVSPRQLAGIKLELRDYIRQLWTVPNLDSEVFAVGTLCKTHEILFSSKRTYPHRGPFKSSAEYSEHVHALFGRVPHFGGNTKPVFDHMDWFQSNIVLHPNLEKIAAIIDWEYAGYTPEPRDMHVGDLPIEKWARPEWADIFDGLQPPKIEDVDEIEI
jgi:aminoglycoside phosphotransferase (APT) family kinase protein